MRLPTLLLAWILSISLTGQGRPEIVVTMDLRGATLTDAITRLEAAHGLRFSFPRQEVEGVQVNCSFEGAEWATVEQCLFGLNGLAATRLDDGYVSLRPVPPGTVRDWQLSLLIRDEDHLPLPFTTITAPAAAQTADAEGNFRGALPASPGDSITFSFVGYDQERVPLRTLIEGRRTITLRESTLALSTVRVYDYLADGIESYANRIVISPDHNPPLPGFAVPEALRTVALLPGVSSLHESAGKLSVRGGNHDQNLVAWDGIPLYGNGYFFGMVSPLSTTLTDRVDVYRGQTEASRGGRVGGVIDLRTAEETTQAFSANGGLSFLGLDGAVKIPLFRGQADLQLAGRGSPGLLLGGPVFSQYHQQVFQSESLQNALDRSSLGASDDYEGFSFREFSGRFSYQFGEGHQLKISGLTAADRFQYLSEAVRINARYADEMATSTNGFSLNYRRPAGGGNLHFEAAQSVYTTEGLTDARRLNNQITTDRSSGIGERSVRLEYQREDERANRITVGAQAQRYANKLAIGYINLRADSNRIYDSATEPGVAVAPYAQYDQRLFGKLKAGVGFRLQWYAPAGRLYPEPRMNLGYEIHDNWQAQAAYTISHQFPQEVINLDPQRISAVTSYWILADDDRLPVATGRELSAGLTGRPKSWLFDLQAYHRTVEGITSLNTLLVQSRRERGQARSYGINVLAGRRWPGLRVWGIYTLSRAEWLFPEQSSEWFAADNDRPHELQLMATYRKKGWSVTGGWQWQSGAPYTEVTGVETRRPVTGRLRSRAITTGLNTARLPTYQRLDLTVGYAWPARPRGPAGAITLSLLNGLGRQNILERRYALEADGTEVVARSIDRVGLGTTVNLGISVNIGGKQPPAAD